MTCAAIRAQLAGLLKDRADLAGKVKGDKVNVKESQAPPVNPTIPVKMKAQWTTDWRKLKQTAIKITLRPECNRPLTLFLLGLLLLSALPNGGCGLADSLNKAIDTAKESTNKTVAVLDDAINNLSNQSADWQRILQDTVANLTGEAQKTIRDEVSDVLQKGIATTGGEFRCDTDFVRTRIRQDLINIKIKLLGGQPAENPPSLCNVVPLAVDVSRVRNNDLKTLDFFGYDLNARDLKVILYNGNTPQDVSAALARPTHYHLTLNLGGNGIALTPGSQKIALLWKGDEISSISIIQPTTLVCRERVDSFTPSPLDFRPLHLSGDRDFDGHGPRVTATVRLLPTPSRVEADVYMSAVETRSDWTRAAGSKRVTIYSPPPGWVVDAINGGTQSDASYVDDNQRDDVFNPGGNGPVQRFVFSGDGPGDDAGLHTGVQVYFNQIKFVLRENKNCVTGRTFSALRDQHLINLETTRRLERQISPALLNDFTRREQ